MTQLLDDFQVWRRINIPWYKRAWEHVHLWIDRILWRRLDFEYWDDFGPAEDTVLITTVRQAFHSYVFYVSLYQSADLQYGVVFTPEVVRDRVGFQIFRYLCKDDRVSVGVLR